MPRLVAALGAFGPGASATQAVAAVASAATAAGWSCDQAPLSDGGAGFAEVFDGRARPAQVHGPLGARVQAEWWLLDDGRTAIVEAAAASGLALAGGPDSNDPIRADSTGTGELIAAAVRAGARRVIVGVGGSAATDGGLATLDVLEPHSRLRGVELVGAFDTTTLFLDSARVFGPRKGASPAQVELLSRRLERLAQVYEQTHGIDVRGLPGGGAGGGLAGGLAAVGATLVTGFELVADTIELAERIEDADLVLAGEAFLDEESFHGQSVGGVVALAAQAGVPVVVVAGEGLGDEPVPTRFLVDRFGPDRAWSDPLACLGQVVGELLADSGGAAVGGHLG